MTDSGTKLTLLKRDNWEKVGALSPLLCGVLISIVGTYCTYSYNQQQLKIQQVQTIGSFIPHLMGNEQSKRAAILALYTMTDTATASKFAQIFASTGTVSALQSMSRTGSDKDKSIASEALSTALQNMAQQGALTKLEDDYQKKLATINNAGKGNSYTAYNMTKLAQIYIMRGQYDLAEPLLQRSLALRDKLYGHDNPELCDTLRSLGEVSFQTGKITQAESYIKRVHTIEQDLATAAPPAVLATTTPVNSDSAVSPISVTSSGLNSRAAMEITPITVDATIKDSTVDSTKPEIKDADKSANPEKMQLSGAGHQG